MTLIRLLSLRAILLLLAVVCLGPGRSTAQPAPPAKPPAQTAATPTLPAKLTVGLLLPQSGTYSKERYETVCKQAVIDMHKENILTATQLKYYASVSSLSSRCCLNC